MDFIRPLVPPNVPPNESAVALSGGRQSESPIVIHNWRARIVRKWILLNSLKECETISLPLDNVAVAKLHSPLDARIAI